MARLEYLKKIRDLPTCFVVFGATGDLARKKIFPSFFELFQNKLLPAQFKIVAAARSQFTSENFIQGLRENVKVSQESDWQQFAKLIEYISCDIEKGENLDKISRSLESFEKVVSSCATRVFYMAVSAAIYEGAFENLGKHQLNLGCQVHGKGARIVIEKPFGFDFKSSQTLNQKLDAYFEESQIYRIDHYLAKETVQNIFAFRFANEIFEPVWNNRYVDYVQITLAEHVGVEKRGEYYDKVGALRDVVQNHMLQILSIVSLEEPTKFNRESIRQRKLEILGSLKKLTPQDVLKSTVRGQYDGYKNEEKVDPNSQTETFAMVKLYIDNARWHGVPFYLRTGKKLMGKVTSIIFSFKEKGHPIFKAFMERPIPNHINIQIDPTEGIGLRLVAKKPGVTTVLEPVDMEFCYKTSFESPQPNAYERLLLDIIVGDQTLFLGPIGPSWKFIDPIREVWDKGKPKLTSYQPGSWGPKEAAQLMAKDGQQWLAPYLTICKI